MGFFSHKTHCLFTISTKIEHSLVHIRVDSFHFFFRKTHVVTKKSIYR